MKNTNIFKPILFSLLIVSLFFFTLETIQRARYAIRFRSTYWLAYGFREKPRDYDKMHQMGMKHNRVNVEIVEVPLIDYDGYKKYNPKCKTVPYKINSFGFRGDEFNINKPEGTYRIVALGGSTTFGLRAEDGHTYPELLEDALKKGGLKNVEVINAGVSSSTIKHIANLFNSEIVKLDPDMIIINSLFNNLFYSQHTYSHRLDGPHIINHFLLNKSLLYTTIREKLAYMLHKPAGDIYKAPLKNMVKNFLDDDNFWFRFRLMYESIVKTAMEQNIKIIIITQPVWLRDHKKGECSIMLDNRFKPVYDRAKEVLFNMTGSRDIRIIDAQELFSLRQDKDKLFSDGLHLTHEGNALLAETIENHIRNQY